jgi:hypothetical protein
MGSKSNGFTESQRALQTDQGWEPKEVEKRDIRQDEATPRVLMDCSHHPSLPPIYTQQIQRPRLELTGQY